MFANKPPRWRLFQHRGPVAKNTIGCCFLQLRLIWSYIKSLPLGAAKAAVAAFVTFRVDRCNSLLACVPLGWTPVGAYCRGEAYLQQQKIRPRHATAP